MTWIELHGDVFWNKKTVAAARLVTDGDVHRLVGHLCRLWTWALDHAEDGDLAHLSPRDIAEAAGWRKDPKAFVDALRVVHFIDPDMGLHDWHDYAGRLVERRQRDRERKKRERANLSLKQLDEAES